MADRPDTCVAAGTAVPHLTGFHPVSPRLVGPPC
jgi:hypothetical protein